MTNTIPPGLASAIIPQRGVCPDCNATGIHLEHDKTCPSGRDIDRLSRSDAEYFDAHPGKATRRRKAGRTEIDQAKQMGSAFPRRPVPEVLVTRVAPGRRHKSFLGTGLAVIEIYAPDGPYA